jgi:hypothetical protein
MWSIPESLDALVIARTIILNSSKMRTASERSHFMGIAEKMIRTARQSLRLKRAADFDAQEVYDTLLGYLDSNNRTNLGRLVGGLSSSQVDALLDLEQGNQRLTQILNLKKQQLSEGDYDDSDDQSSSHYTRLEDKDDRGKQTYLEKLTEAELDSLYQYSDLMENENLSSLIASVLAQKSRKKRVRTDNVAPKGTSGGYVRKPLPSGELDFKQFQENIMDTASWAWSSTWLMMCGYNFYIETESLIKRESFVKKDLKVEKLQDILENETFNLSDTFYLGTKHDSQREGFSSNDRKDDLKEILIKTRKALVGDIAGVSRRFGPSRSPKEETAEKGSLSYLVSTLAKGTRSDDKVGYLGQFDAFWDLYVESLTGIPVKDTETDFEALARKIYRTSTKLRPHSAFSEIYRDYARMYAKIRIAKATGNFDYEKGQNTVTVRHRKALATCKYLPNKIAQVMKRYAEEFNGRKTVFIEDAGSKQLAGDPLDVDGVSASLESALEGYSELQDKVLSQAGEMEFVDEEAEGAQTAESRANLPTISELVESYTSEPKDETGKEAARLIFENLLNNRLPEKHIRFLLQNLNLLSNDAADQEKATTIIYSRLFARGFLTPAEKSLLEQSASDERRDFERKVTEIYYQKVTSESKDITKDWFEDILVTLFADANKSAAFQAAKEDPARQAIFDVRPSEKIKEVIRRRFGKVTFNVDLIPELDSFPTSVPQTFFEAIRKISDTERSRTFTKIYDNNSDAMLKLLQKASRLRYLRTLLINIPAKYSGDKNKFLVNEIQDYRYLLSDADQVLVNEFQEVKHPLNSFRRDQYESLHKSRLDSDAYSAYLASFLTEDKLESLLESAKKDDGGVDLKKIDYPSLLSDPDLVDLVQSATNNFIKAHYSSSFLKRSRLRHPDFIRADRVLRALSTEKESDSDEDTQTEPSGEVKTSQEVKSLREAALGQEVSILLENKNKAVSNYLDYSKKNNIEPAHRDLFQSLSATGEGLEVNSDLPRKFDDLKAETIKGRQFILKDLEQGRIKRARSLRENMNLDANLYQEVENAYVMFHLGSDVRARVKLKVWSDFAEHIKKQEEKIKDLENNPDENILVELEGGYHQEQIKLKRLYIQRKEAFKEALLAARREQATPQVAYHPVLESKYEFVRKEVIKRVEDTVKFATKSRKDSTEKALADLNKLRVQFGERAITDMFREARIFGSPTNRTASAFVNFLRNQEFQEAFDFPAGGNLDALCDFILAGYSGESLCVSVTGQTYTPSGLFQNFNLQEEMTDFLRGYFIYHSSQLNDINASLEFNQLTRGQGTIQIAGVIPSKWRATLRKPTYTFMGDHFRNTDVSGSAQKMNTTYRLALLRLTEVFISPDSELKQEVKGIFEGTADTRNLYSKAGRAVKQRLEEEENTLRNFKHRVDVLGYVGDRAMAPEAVATQARNIISELTARGDSNLIHTLYNTSTPKSLANLDDALREYSFAVGFLSLIDPDELDTEPQSLYLDRALLAIQSLPLGSLNTLVGNIAAAGDEAVKRFAQGEVAEIILIDRIEEDWRAHFTGDALALLEHAELVFAEGQL